MVDASRDATRPLPRAPRADPADYEEDDMSTANPAPQPALSAVPGRAGWAVVSLAAVGVALFSVPPYLLDAAVSRIPLNPAVVSHFLWIAAHAVLGSLALLLRPVQFLPWARRRFPKAHPLGRASLPPVQPCGQRHRRRGSGHVRGGPRGADRLPAAGFGLVLQRPSGLTSPPAKAGTTSTACG